MEALLSSLQTWAADSPDVLRVLVGVLGAVVLLAGARLAKAALVMASFGVGAVGAVLLVQGLAVLVPDLGRPLVMGVGACVGGLAVVLVARVAVRFALGAAGALTGLVATGAVMTAIEPRVLPAWSLLVGVVVGAVALPLAAPLLLRGVAAAVGAVLVAWAVGLPTHPWLLLGLFGAGVAVQLGIVGGRREEEAKE